MGISLPVQQADISVDNSYSNSYSANPRLLWKSLPGKYEEFLKRICKSLDGQGNVF